MDDEIRPISIQPLLVNDYMELANINERDREIENLPRDTAGRKHGNAQISFANKYKVGDRVGEFTITAVKLTYAGYMYLGKSADKTEIFF